MASVWLACQTGYEEHTVLAVCEDLDLGKIICEQTRQAELISLLEDNLTVYVDWRKDFPLAERSEQLRTVEQLRTLLANPCSWQTMVREPWTPVEIMASWALRDDSPILTHHWYRVDEYRVRRS